MSACEGAGAIAEEVRQATATACLGPLSLVRHLDAKGLEEGVPRIPTGWPRLDAALGGGFAVPSLNVLGAAPKSGKSTWAQMVAAHHVEAGGVAYVLDLENGRRRYTRQLLCRLSRLGPREVADAHRDRFASLDAVQRWAAAKTKLRSTSQALYAEFTPPDDLVARLAEVKRAAGGRPLLVVIDSLQKLPGGLEDRRATIDGWVRLFERLRNELEAVFLVISEIRRGKDGYEPREDAFKESGSIEYTADLAMTLSRPRADEDEEPVSTLRVWLARDCDEDPRGDVASYAPVRPFYGLEEREPPERKGLNRRGPRAEKTEAAREWLEVRLSEGPAPVNTVLRDAQAVGISRTVVYRAKRDLGATSCTLDLGSAWRLP